MCGFATTVQAPINVPYRTGIGSTVGTASASSSYVAVHVAGVIQSLKPLSV